jgi:hypothetical protein
MPISGASGKAEVLEEGGIVKYHGTTLVDNAWSAPAASGCGGILSFLVDPIINAQLGLPSAAGHNTAKQETSNYLAATETVNEH